MLVIPPRLKDHPAGTTTGTFSGNLTGTASGNSVTIASGACATVVDATATGVLSTDAIIVTPKASIKAVTGYIPATTGGLTIAGYPTADAVHFDVCNWSTGRRAP